MKNRFPNHPSIGQLERHGGKKLGQRGTEFFRKEREVRKHSTGSYRGRKG